MSREHIICGVLWLFGRQFGLHLVYLQRPVRALVWYFIGDTVVCWVIDLFLISRYIEELNAASSESAQEDNQRPKVLNIRSLLAFEVWHSAIFTEAAITVMARNDVQVEWIRLAPLVTVPLSLWWVARTNYKAVPWQAALGSGLVAFGIFFTLLSAVVKQGKEAAELLSKTEQKKFLMPLLTTTILNVWQHRASLTAQCVRLLKLLVKLVVVLLLSAAVIFLILQPHYLSYTREAPYNKDHSRHRYTPPPTMTDHQKLLRACEVLSVHPGVSDAMLTVVYRHLAREWHPDKHQGQENKDAAAQRFIEIQEAYQYLSDRLTKSGRTAGRRK